MNTRTEPFGPEYLLARLSRYPVPSAYCVALSGGLDSTALLIALHEAADRLAAPLRALHVNHGAHPESDAWQAHCADRCEALAVPLTCIQDSPDAESDAGPEANLRALRYRAFIEALQEGELLLLAHHLEDQAETMMLHLLRGSGVDGLAGMPEERPLGHGRLARPLLDVSRSDLESLLRSRSIQWLEDPSNSDTGLDRNYLRHQVMPLLRARWPMADRSMARSSTLCREASVGLHEKDGRALDVLSVHSHVLEPGRAGWDWLTLKRLLRLWARERGSPPIPGSKLEEFGRQLQQARPEAALELAWDSWRIRRHQGRLWLQGAEAAEPCPDVDWTKPGTLQLGPGLGTLHLTPEVEADWPPGLQVSARQRGQTIRLRKGGPARRIKDLIREAGIPPWLRNHIPVLIQGTQVLAVGDWLLSHSLIEWLLPRNGQLTWRPSDPALVWTRETCHLRALESGQDVG